MFETFKITWDEYGKLTISDLDITWKTAAIEYLRQNFFANDPLFRMLSDENGGLEHVYMEYFHKLLRGEVCVLAVDEKEDKIYGIALCKWMTKDWFSWTDMKYTLSGDTLLNQLLNVTFMLIKQHYLEDPNHNFFDSLHLFEYLVESEYRYDEAFMGKFFDAICEVARNLKMPRVTTLGRIQFECDECIQHGFQEIHKLIYSMYIVDKTRPFDCLRDNDEMYCALYEKVVEPIIPYEEMDVHEITFVYTPPNPKK